MRHPSVRYVIASAFAAALFAHAMAPASAQVTRCTDAAGKVSYTDKACPASTQQSKQLEGIETNGTSIPVPGIRAQPSASAEAGTVSPARTAMPRQNNTLRDSGLVVIDPRAQVPQQDQPGRDVVRDGGYPYAYSDPYSYPYAGYPGVYRRGLNPPQNLSPTLRHCDAGGCNDTLGNHYDRTGKVDRYVRPDGRTCRPVGTTVVC